MLNWEIMKMEEKTSVKIISARTEMFQMESVYIYVQSDWFSNSELETAMGKTNFRLIFTPHIYTWTGIIFNSITVEEEFLSSNA